MNPPPTSRPLLSVVVPVHNEADLIPTALPRLVAEVTAIDPSAQVIVVENGSTDATAALARRHGGDRVEVLQLDEPDYGNAQREGFLHAHGEWVVSFDIDYFSGAFLEKVMSVADRSDLVIASKRDPESDDRRPPLRRFATFVFNLLLRMLLHSKVSDTHGIKAFRAEIVSEVAPKVVSRRDLFDTELVIRSERAGYRIVEVPVVIEELRPARSSLLARVPRTLRGMWEIRRLLAS